MACSACQNDVMLEIADACGGRLLISCGSLQIPEILTAFTQPQIEEMQRNLGKIWHRQVSLCVCPSHCWHSLSGQQWLGPQSAFVVIRLPAVDHTSVVEEQRHQDRRPWHSP